MSWKTARAIAAQRFISYSDALFGIDHRRTKVGRTAANSFVLPERALNSFVMPDVQMHYLVSTCIFNEQRGRGGVTDR